MTYERKTFNYQTATVDEVAQHFLSSSRQAIASARKCWLKDAAMTNKLNAAFFSYKQEELREMYREEWASYVVMCL